MALETITGDPRNKEAQLAGKFTVLFDSGIRSGADIFRAIALGAQGVLRESRASVLSDTHMSLSSGGDGGLR